MIAVVCWYRSEPDSLPELPEIEHLKRTLQPALIGAAVVRTNLHRRDIVHPFGGFSGRIAGASLLAGTRMNAMERRGKNLALIGESGAVVCVHLGMSGQLRFVPHGQKAPNRDHIHSTWHLENRHSRGRLLFRDPRRFGGLWTFPSLEALRAHRWGALGPDALHVTADGLLVELKASRRPIKAALLDQSVLSGVGNIYADEALFDAGIHPLSASGAIPRRGLDQLAGAIRQVLRAAVKSGGSTIRSYQDGNGQSGRFAR